MLRRAGDVVNGFALAITLAVGVAALIGVLLFSRHHYDELIGSAHATAMRQADLIRLALEHQMEENERDLLAQMVASFARDPTIDQVAIQDREGRTRFSSTEVIEREGEPLEECHTGAGAPGSRLLELPQGPVLRTVLPIENRPACHRCHDEDQAVNGALVVDVRAGEVRRAVDRDVRWLVAVTGAISLGLLVAIAVIVRLFLLRRLRQFEAAARAIAAGQLECRLPASGRDTLSWMARAFNAMADSVMRLARELREQRELLEMVINSVDDGIAVLDPSLHLVAANAAFLGRGGASRKSAAGKRCGHACAAEGCPARRCFQTGTLQRAVLTRPQPDGTSRFEELHASPIISGGTIVAVVEVWRDITERRLAEARLGESHRMASLGMLASGFSHELNTPLGTTLTCLEGVLRQVRAEAPLEGERRGLLLEQATLGREQILRCRGITQQFLRLSRGQAASTDLVELGRIAGAVVRLCEPTARERGVEVRCDVGGDAITVRASDAELQQVLLNLILNATQACARGGHVKVEVVAGPPRILVQDDGCGIPAEQQARIFEPFYGLRPGGTGLGLFLSLAMARSWGAEITCRSAPGQGATFEVAFAGADEARAAEVA